MDNALEVLNEIKQVYMKFHWCWEFKLRGVHLGISYSWHVSLPEGYSHHVSVGFIIGLLAVEW